MSGRQFVFVILDNGQLKRTIVHSNLEVLAGFTETAIRQYLDNHGVWDVGKNELSTEDGYGTIVSIHLDIPDDNQHIWSYSFDGEETVSEAVKRIIEHNETCGDRIISAGNQMTRYYINTYRHDEDFLWIYLGRKNSKETDDEIELYHEIHNLSRMASKASFYEITMDEYLLLKATLYDDECIC